MKIKLGFKMLVAIFCQPYLVMGSVYVITAIKA